MFGVVSRRVISIAKHKAKRGAKPTQKENMGLDELQKKLYKQDSEFEDRPGSPYSLEPGEKNAADEQESVQNWQQEVPKMKFSQKVSRFFRNLFSFTPSQKKYFLISGIILLILIVGLVVFVYWYGQNAFDRTWVKFAITGPERVVSGENLIYILKYKNDTKVVLNDAQLTFFWPENSLPESGELAQKISLNDLAPGQEKEIEFKGKLIGLKGVQREVKATLSYQPAKTTARFENIANFRTEIISVPLILSFDMPEKTSSGQQITASLKYLNDSDSSFKDLAIKIEYPGGFRVSSVYPQPQENVWQIGTLESRQEGKILVTGIIEGERGDVQTFRAIMGTIQDGDFIPYVDTVKSCQIALPILSLEPSINGSYEYIANAGETLTYKIKYQNNSHLGVPSVKITAKFNTKALDFTSLDLRDKASFDSTTNTVMWDQTTAPELEFLDPGKSGEFIFTAKVKENLPISNFNDKNFVINCVVHSESNNVPLALMSQQVPDTSELATKINTKLSVDARGVYDDTYLSNSGPIPPKVGETTSYTIYWQVTNASNDAEDIRVEAVLPAHVTWLNKYKPASANLKYDTLNRKITWEIGRLPAGTGVITPVNYIAFQIGLTPSAPQINQVVELIKSSVIKGKDSFTNTNLESSDASINSDLPDDPTMGWEKGRVAQ